MLNPSPADVAKLFATAPISARALARLESLNATAARLGYSVELVEHTSAFPGEGILVVWFQRRRGERLDTRLRVTVSMHFETGRPRWTADAEHHLDGYTRPPVTQLDAWLRRRAISR